MPSSPPEHQSQQPAPHPEAAPSTARGVRSGDERPAPTDTRLRPLDEPPTAAELTKLHQHPDGPTLIYPPAPGRAALLWRGIGNKFKSGLPEELAAAANSLPHSSQGRHDSGNLLPDGRPDVKVSTHSQSFKTHLDPLTLKALHGKAAGAVTRPLRDALGEEGHNLTTGNQVLEAAGRLDFRTQEHHRQQEVRRNVLERLARQDSQQTWHPVDGQRVTDQLHGSTSATEGVQRLLGGHDGRPGFDGIVLGEAHGASPSWGFLSENMRDLKAAGVDRIYVESLRDDAFQRDLEAYQRPGGTMSPNLEQMLRTYDRSFNSPEGKGLYDTVVQAKAEGVAVHAVDGYPARRPSGVGMRPLEERARLLNSYMNHAVSNGGPGKYVLVTGTAHVHEHPTSTEHRIPGVAEMLGVPAVRLTDAGLPHPDGAPHDASARTDAGDLRLGHLAPERTGQDPADAARPDGGSTSTPAPAPTPDRSGPTRSTRGLDDEITPAPHPAEGGRQGTGPRDFGSLPSSHPAPTPHQAPPAPPSTTAHGTGASEHQQPRPADATASARSADGDTPPSQPAPSNSRKRGRDEDEDDQPVSEREPKRSRTPSYENSDAVMQDRGFRAVGPHDPLTQDLVSHLGGEAKAHPPVTPELLGKVNPHAAPVHPGEGFRVGDDLNACMENVEAYRDTHFGRPRVAGQTLHGDVEQNPGSTLWKRHDAPARFGEGTAAVPKLMETVRAGGPGSFATVLGAGREGTGHVVALVHDQDGQLRWADLSDRTTAPATGGLPENFRSDWTVWASVADPHGNNISGPHDPEFVSTYSDFARSGDDGFGTASSSTHPPAGSDDYEHKIDGEKVFDTITTFLGGSPDFEQVRSEVEGYDRPALVQGDTDTILAGYRSEKFRHVDVLMRGLEPAITKVDEALAEVQRELPTAGPDRRVELAARESGLKESRELLQDQLDRMTIFQHERLKGRLKGNDLATLTRERQEAETRVLPRAIERIKAEEARTEALLAEAKAMDAVEQQRPMPKSEKPSKMFASRADELEKYRKVELAADRVQREQALKAAETALKAAGVPVDLKNGVAAPVRPVSPVGKSVPVPEPGAPAKPAAGGKSAAAPKAKSSKDVAAEWKQFEDNYRNAFGYSEHALQQQQPHAEQVVRRLSPQGDAQLAKASVNRNHVIADYMVHKYVTAAVFKARALDENGRPAASEAFGDFVSVMAPDQHRILDTYGTKAAQRLRTGGSEEAVLVRRDLTAKPADVDLRATYGNEELQGAFDPAGVNDHRSAADAREKLEHELGRNGLDVPTRGQLDALAAAVDGVHPTDPTPGQLKAVRDAMGDLETRVREQAVEDLALVNGITGPRMLDETVSALRDAAVRSDGWLTQGDRDHLAGRLDDLAARPLPAAGKQALTDTAKALRGNRATAADLTGLADRLPGDRDGLRAGEIDRRLGELGNPTKDTKRAETKADAEVAAAEKKRDNLTNDLSQARTDLPLQEAAHAQAKQQAEDSAKDAKADPNDAVAKAKAEADAAVEKELREKAKDTRERIPKLETRLVNAERDVATAKTVRARVHEVYAQELQDNVQPGKQPTAAQKGAAARVAWTVADVELVGRQYGGVHARAGAGGNHPAGMFDRALTAQVEDVPALIEEITAGLSNSGSNLRFGDETVNKWIQNFLDPHIIRDPELLTAVAHGQLPAEALYAPHTADLVQAVRRLEAAGLVPPELRDIMASKTQTDLEPKPNDTQSPSSRLIVEDLGVVSDPAPELPVSSSGDFAARAGANPLPTDRLARLGNEEIHRLDQVRQPGDIAVTTTTADPDAMVIDSDPPSSQPAQPPQPSHVPDGDTVMADGTGTATTDRPNLKRGRDAMDSDSDSDSGDTSRASKLHRPMAGLSLNGPTPPPSTTAHGGGPQGFGSVPASPRPDATPPVEQHVAEPMELDTPPHSPAAEPMELDTPPHSPVAEPMELDTPPVEQHPVDRDGDAVMQEPGDQAQADQAPAAPPQGAAEHGTKRGREEDEEPSGQPEAKRRRTPEYENSQAVMEDRGYERIGPDHPLTGELVNYLGGAPNLHPPMSNSLLQKVNPHREPVEPAGSFRPGDDLKACLENVEAYRDTHFGRPRVSGQTVHGTVEPIPGNTVWKRHDGPALFGQGPDAVQKLMETVQAGGPGSFATVLGIGTSGIGHAVALVHDRDGTLRWADLTDRRVTTANGAMPDNYHSDWTVWASVADPHENNISGPHDPQFMERFSTFGESSHPSDPMDIDTFGARREDADGDSDTASVRSDDSGSTVWHDAVEEMSPSARSGDESPTEWHDALEQLPVSEHAESGSAPHGGPVPGRHEPEIAGTTTNPTDRTSARDNRPEDAPENAPENGGTVPVPPRPADTSSTVVPPVGAHGGAGPTRPRSTSDPAGLGTRAPAPHRPDGSVPPLTRSNSSRATTSHATTVTPEPHTTTITPEF
ncbi:toxin glutamine deamidase domain-containing protein, partial [Kitasatospora sp. NPDC057198]|uniref:toxin glutamine deamidase domain-containing protein n=1 Tax=Kitasatospora sp. NPDC057198 TaxID=3346046 RepID=UPI003642CC17